RAAQGVLRLLEAFHGLRVGEHLGGQVHLRLVGLGARLRHGGEHALLLIGEPLDRLHQVGNEVRAPLVLAQYFRPLGFGRLLVAWDVVDATTGKCGGERQNGAERHDSPKALAKHRASSSKPKACATLILARRLMWGSICGSKRGCPPFSSATDLAPERPPALAHPGKDFMPATPPRVPQARAG